MSRIPRLVSTFKGRRWGSHPHRPHYECGAFLTRATPASCVWRELNPAPRGSQSRMQAITPQTQRKGWESNPQGLAAHSRSRRGPSPARVAHPIVPGGIEPPISSVSGRRLRHWTTGLSVPRPGVEPGTPRSKRGMMSVSPPGHSAEGEGVEPAFPVKGNHVSTVARPAVSGYLPYPSVETVGIEPTAVCLQDRLATLGTCVPLLNRQDRKSTRLNSSHSS